MKNIIVEVPKIKISEIKLTNDNEITLQVATWLYDNKNNYIGTINLSSNCTADNTLTVSKEIIQLIADLFIKVEKIIAEKNTITFTGN